MISAKTNKMKFVDLLIIALLLLRVRASPCQAQEPNQPDSAQSELRLEGKDVERLVLRRKDGHTERFDKPREVVRLPVGQYHLLESHLSSGYTCFQGPGPTVQWTTVTEEEPALLKVGTPLRQVLDVKRHGRELVLDYKLLGVGGESYTTSNRSNPPTFAIYKGDKQIASGQFKFG